MTTLYFRKMSTVAPSSPSASPPHTTLCEALSVTGPHGIISRFQNGQLGNFFAANHSHVESAATHADTIVNLFTLASTLLLTCPYAVMGSLQTSAWVDLRDNLAKCTSNPWTGATPWAAADVDFYVETHIYPNVASSMLVSIYTSFFTIMCSIIFYMTRPNADKSSDAASKDAFKAWWRRGRVLLIFICIGMLASLVSVCTFSNVIYTNFIGPPNLFCANYRQRWSNYVRLPRLFCSALLLLLLRFYKYTTACSN